jgi:hypothetical protein
MCGTNTLSVNTPIAGVEWNGVRPGDHDPAGCPFEGTATGARLLAGTTGITVLAWIAHDGSFSSTGGVGDPHHDFKFACGTIDPDCANFPIT